MPMDPLVETQNQPDSSVESKQSDCLPEKVAQRKRLRKTKALRSPREQLEEEPKVKKQRTDTNSSNGKENTNAFSDTPLVLNDVDGSVLTASRGQATKTKAKRPYTRRTPRDGVRITPKEYIAMRRGEGETSKSDGALRYEYAKLYYVPKAKKKVDNAKELQEAVLSIC